MKDIKEALEGRFWTDHDEMISDIEDLGCEIICNTWERIGVVDSEDDTPIILNVGHANNTMWISEFIC